MNRWLPVIIVLVIGAVTVWTYQSLRQARELPLSWHTGAAAVSATTAQPALPAPPPAPTVAAPQPPPAEPATPPPLVPPPPPSETAHALPATSAVPEAVVAHTAAAQPPLEGKLVPEMFVYSPVPFEAPLASFPLLLVGQQYISWPFYFEMLAMRGLLPVDYFAVGDDRFIVPVVPPTPLSPSGEGGGTSGGDKGHGYGYGYGYGFNGIGLVGPLRTLALP